MSWGSLSDVQASRFNPDPAMPPQTSLQLLGVETLDMHDCTTSSPLSLRHLHLHVRVSVDRPTNGFSDAARGPRRPFRSSRVVSNRNVAHDPRLQTSSNMAQCDSFPRPLLGIDPILGLPQRISTILDTPARIKHKQRWKRPAKQSRLPQWLAHLLR